MVGTLINLINCCIKHAHSTVYNSKQHIIFKEREEQESSVRTEDIALWSNRGQVPVVS